MIPDAVAQLAAGAMGPLAARFASAGCGVALPAPGILRITPAGMAPRPSVLVSVGVHGDETGPISMLAQVLEALAHEAAALAVDLLVCVGNLAAIAAGRRYIDADLNRMFRSPRGTSSGAAEAQRAATLIAASAAFFGAAAEQRWHLDLHSAIRASLYPTFAIVPELIEPARKAALCHWLGQAAIGAIVFNTQPSGTYSYHSAQQWGAAAGTLELGRVGPLGASDDALQAGVRRALDGLLRGAAPEPAVTAPPLFSVVQEIIKLSAQFQMTFDGATPNFAALPAGAVIARDGATLYRVGPLEELVLFPNPAVQPGLRAGLMVVRRAPLR